MAETLESAPGLVMDLFEARLHYDDQQHGIKRKKLGAWEDE